MKAAPTRRDPVPESDWRVTILPSARSGESAPNMSSALTLLKAANPSIGRYSLLFFCATTRSSALRTTESTTGWRLSSLYAPTPRFSLRSSSSARNACVTPRMGSAGACSTPSNMELSAATALATTWECLMPALAERDVAAKPAPLLLAKHPRLVAKAFCILLSFVPSFVRSQTTRCTCTSILGRSVVVVVVVVVVVGFRRYGKRRSKG
mmetsp:Transcript_7106/g.17380  ORF Transcript_7106/g.17380 Transcript_7106/m.17380 type:complete len:209 (+) Transcript_7106:508-1134(+)